MDKNPSTTPIVQVFYDAEEDTLFFLFPIHPRPAVAEEVGDEVWIRFDPQTKQLVTMEVLHFSCRIRETFGPTLTYTERTDPQRLSPLYGLPGNE
jgi:hypothetical protein